MLRLIILRVLESFFRRPFLSLLPTLILTVAGIAFLANKEEIYFSGGKINIQDDSVVSRVTNIGVDQSIWTTPAEDTSNQFSELIASEAFVRAVIVGTEWEEELADPEVDIDELYGYVREDIWTEEIGDNTVAVVATSTDPATSKQLADNMIRTFINWNTQNDLSDARSSVEFFNELVEQERSNFDIAEEELRQFLIDYPEPVRGDRPEVEELEIDRLQAIVDDASIRLNQARDQLNTAELAYKKAETDTAQKYLVIDQPRVPEDAESSLSGQIIQLAIFMIIGGIMGLLGVFGGALLDRSFRYPVDIRESLELPVLGVVPTGNNVEAQPMPAFASASQASAPPPVYRTKLTPNVDPPTLIIMPGEKAELERIAKERGQHHDQVRLSPA